MLAASNQMTSIISHRSGETEDNFIADLAVALTPARSKQDLHRVQTGLPNTTNCSGSRKHLVIWPGIREKPLNITGKK
jgi:hypothetical protein